ncbi:hypothetical protein TNIN_350231 [Trichonephila inaurata madagascariensis]|uniref:Uncharacterized protein n=1 Tax=Trichonephila inaurata madagascariensis TaxID=2747483 RepID=A0A8X6XN10_9ARAC|nr:hypothetical protein TNIN_350231 [Trichonephila inaurata madagascariensis]
MVCRTSYVMESSLPSPQWYQNVQIDCRSIGPVELISIVGVRNGVATIFSLQRYVWPTNILWVAAFGEYGSVVRGKDIFHPWDVGKLEEDIVEDGLRLDPAGARFDVGSWIGGFDFI